MAIERPIPARGGLPDDGRGMEVNHPPQGMMIEVTPTEDGGAIIDLDPSETKTVIDGTDHEANLAEELDEHELTLLGKKVVEWYEADERSRDDWRRIYTDGMELLGLKSEDRSDPWEGACGVFHPVLTEAVVRFQSQAILEIFPASGPVKTKIIGKWTDDKEKQAKRVQDELNFYVCDKMTEFRPETETLLFYLALAGSAFRKSYYDPILKRPTSLFVPAEDFIVPYGATDLRSCPRYTHVMRRYLNDIRKDTEAGFYRAVELNRPIHDTTEFQREKDKLEGRSPTYNTDERYVILECHCNWNLQGFEDIKIERHTGRQITTGIELPYVVTVEKDSGKVLAIRRNWEKQDPAKCRVQHFTAYHYLPGMGFYGSGLIHLIGGIAKSSTSILRQLVDAGTLSNLPGGLKTRGLRIKGDDTPIMPGEFRDVDVPSGSIRDNITFVPYKEPSQVLHELLNDMVAEGRRLGAAPDLPINSMTQQAPVGTTLALLERSMKIMSAVQARLHASLKQDLKKISDLIAKYMGPQYEFDVDDPNASRVDDFSQVDIVPVSDPNAASMAQRVVQYQAALQLAAQDPTAFDKTQLYKDMFTILGIPNADKIVKDPSNVPPMDPVSENMALLVGKPVKAFLWQDHQAHISSHLAIMHDPKITQLVQQSPQAALVIGAATAHVAEHLGMEYRQEIEQQMGVALPPPDQPLPQDVEVQLSRVVAVAAQRLLGKDMQEQQAAQAAQAAQDPVLQLQQQELKVKAAEVMRKAGEDRRRAIIDVLKLYQQAASEKDNIQSRERISGAQMGVKIAESHHDHAVNERDKALETLMELFGHAKDAQQSDLDRLQESHQKSLDRVHEALQNHADRLTDLATTMKKNQDGSSSPVGVNLAQAIKSQGENFASGMAKLHEALTSDQEVVRGPDQRIIGSRRIPRRT